MEEARKHAHIHNSKEFAGIPGNSSLLHFKELISTGEIQDGQKIRKIRYY